MKSKKINTVNTLKQPQFVANLTSDKEKYGNDMENIKKLVEYYEQIGWNQVIAKRERFKKLYNLAYGVINPEDYLDVPQVRELKPDINKEELEGVKLNFYPIIPNIVNVLMGEIEKKQLYFRVQAINPEVVNETLDLKNQEVREYLVSKAEQKFMASLDPNMEQEELDQRMQMFQQLPEIQEYYRTSYRPTIEKWANHTMEVENEKFNMKQLSRKIFEALIITENPVAHINLVGDSYYPEALEPHNTFYLKSPYVDDISESMMAGWFSYENISTIITNYGSYLGEEDIKKLEGWNGRLLTNLVPNNREKFLTGNYTDVIDSANNYLTMKSWSHRTTHERYDEYGQTVARVTHMYFLLPKKVGKLTYKKGEEYFQDIVDENFRITDKPTYSTTRKKEQNEFTLLDGEHVEWSYINELWRAVKVDFNSSPNFTKVLTADDKTSSLYILIEKHPIQYKKKGKTFGVSIPMHGGPTSNLYNRSISLVEKCSNWQILYNFLWNRNSQLLSTEVGSFFVFDQNELPNESLGESWQKNPLKVFKVAQDTSLAPFDKSVSNLGGATSASGSFGQVVDLTKTKEVIEKAQLASMVKQECYMLIGITPEQLGDISPYQSSKSVVQGLQRSNTQIQYLYTRHADIMKLVRETMLETAQYLASKSDTVEFTYTTSEGERMLFKSKTDDFPLYELGIFVRNDVNDIEVLENMKNLVMVDNTMGATTLEKALILESKYSTDIIDKLRKLEDEKNAKEQAEQQHQQELMQQKIDADQQALQQKLQFDAEQNELDRKSRILEAQIKTLGYAQGTTDEIASEILDLQKATIQQKELYSSLNIANQAKDLAMKRKEAEMQQQSAKQAQDQNIKMKELQLREKEIVASEHRTKAILAKKQADAKARESKKK